MKILKILIVLLLPVLGMVSCSKSSLKPTTSSAVSNTDGNNASLNGARDGEIYGTGDDDRDGGDKKKKQVGAK
ncbi:MAG: hypothetical protein QM534_01605 [Sediminibacterium sp.]|nr:hypothetical protein [Sediminibacterium sp.]